MASHEKTARMSCALTTPAGHETESEAVFSAIDSVPYFQLRSFVSPNLEQSLICSFTQRNKSVLLCLEFEKKQRKKNRSSVQPYWYTYKLGYGFLSALASAYLKSKPHEAFGAAILSCNYILQLVACPQLIPWRAKSSSKECRRVYNRFHFCGW